MRVAFRYKPGSQVRLNGHGSIACFVRKCSIDAAGEITVEVMDSQGCPILNAKNGTCHKESDLAPAGDTPPPDEPIFVLRGQDVLAAETVRFWEHLARDSGQVNEGKLAGALAIAEQMDAWPTHRLPD